MPVHNAGDDLHALQLSFIRHHMDGGHIPCPLILSTRASILQIAKPKKVQMHNGCSSRRWGVARTRCSSALQEILFILGANLSQIEERWDIGRLRAVGLSAQHVTSLVGSCQSSTAPLSLFISLNGVPGRF